MVIQFLDADKQLINETFHLDAKRNSSGSLTIVISRMVTAIVIACGSDSVPSANSSRVSRRSRILLSISSTFLLNLTILELTSALPSEGGSVSSGLIAGKCFSNYKIVSVVHCYCFCLPLVSQQESYKRF